jgi:pimeloyl-ACP methyl ester carboxylesterase
MLHHLYFSPGMFGFAQLASYDYFGHVKRALEARFREAGQTIEVQVIAAPPTASVRRRAGMFAELIDETAKGKGPIHLLGHSTGGLDARVVASPSSKLPIRAGAMAWLPRLRSITTVNTPHCGTPLASFFATAEGARALHALSAFTFIGLSLGARPLAAAGALIGVLGRGDRAMGIELRLLDRAVDSLVGLVDDAAKPEVRDYLSAVKDDQGAMLQLTPEAMDLVGASFADRPGVTYQSTVSMAPTPSMGKWLGTLGHPGRAISLALFTAMHRITSLHDRRYPCAQGVSPEGDVPVGHPNETALAEAFGAAPDLGANDGVVPLRSQLWGTLVWAGLGDHLDVLGHYRGDEKAQEEEGAERHHHDWLTSGSSFGPAQFDALMDAIANGMLVSAGVKHARAVRSAA